MPKAATTTTAQRSELGHFLRARRAAIAPKDGGARRRRTPGLRREDVAELAGIGVDWYTRLEQGRSVSPSAATLAALARALGLNKTEHAHLQALVRMDSRGERAKAFTRETVPPTLQRILADLQLPAYVTGRRWDVLAWNATADALFGFSRIPPAHCNLLLNMFCLTGSKALFGSTWATEAQRMVAQFRTTFDQWAGDPAFEDLLHRLHQSGPEFSVWWEAHAVRSVASGEKQLTSSRQATKRMEYASFQSNDDPALRLVMMKALA